MWCKVRLLHLGTKLNAHERCTQQPAVCEALTASQNTNRNILLCAPSLNHCSQCHSATHCKYVRAGIGSLFSLTAIHPRCVCTCSMQPHATPRYSQHGNTFRLIPRHRETLYLRVLSVDCIVMCVTVPLRNTYLISSQYSTLVSVLCFPSIFSDSPVCTVRRN
jgi:hypothetical protein